MKGENKSMRATQRRKGRRKCGKKAGERLRLVQFLTVLPYHGIAYVGVTSCHVRIGWNLNKDLKRGSNTIRELTASSAPRLN